MGQHHLQYRFRHDHSSPQAYSRREVHVRPPHSLPLSLSLSESRNHEALQIAVDECRAFTTACGIPFPPRSLAPGGRDVGFCVRGLGSGVLGSPSTLKRRTKTECQRLKTELVGALRLGAHHSFLFRSPPPPSLFLSTRSPFFFSVCSLPFSVSLCSVSPSLYLLYLSLLSALSLPLSI